MQPAAAVEWVQFHCLWFAFLDVYEPESAAVIPLKLTSGSVSAV